MSRPLSAIENRDPRPLTTPAKHGALSRFFLSLINDERDLPFVWLSIEMSVVIPVCAALFYVPGLLPLWVAPAYWALIFLVYLDRFTLMLHNTSHRRLFKRKFRVLNKWIPWLIGPFMGQSPETYYVHHITMHHSEGNLPNDLSTTMPYQRDSFFDWLKYFGRFFFGILIEMTMYQAKKKRWPLVRTQLVGELGFYALCIGLCFVNLYATLIVFVVPFVVIRILMMIGNWGQHAFVDPDEPNNDYKSSITCINSRYNRRAFNDGYHISHHLVANRHWLEHVPEFEENLDKYIENDAIIFEGLDFFLVSILLFFKRYDTLANHFVELRETPREKDEIIALMKRRLQKFSPEQLAAYAK
ncbi:MAG: fatty acid desaturase [Sandaracinaceae bacterium]